jgi:small GTP-binding protein
MGVDFHIHYLHRGGKKLQVTLWDTAGQERFRNITVSYFRGAHGMAVVYDVTSRETFEWIEYWIEEAKRHAGDDVKFVLVGNKCDDNSRRVIDFFLFPSHSSRL